MSSSKATAKRTSKGRQRIDMVKMKNESKLQVTFSKRRCGLFKKANELCTLTGSEMAAVVFLPCERVYSFGSPSVKEIIERFENQQPHILSPSSMIVDAHRRANMQNLNEELGSVEANLERERKRSEELNRMVTESSSRHWWVNQFDELNMDSLNQYRLALEALHENVKLHAGKMVLENPQKYQIVPVTNSYDVAAAASAISTPSASSIFRLSTSNAFCPYDSRPTPAIHPAIPFSSYAGPSISIKNGPSFDLGGTGTGPSGPFDPSASRSSDGDAGYAPPYPFHFFNQGNNGNDGQPFCRAPSRAPIVAIPIIALS